MVNDISILMLLSLISMPVPGIATTIMQYMLQFIQFDILVTSQWLQPWLVQSDDDHEAEVYPNGLNDYFANNGIQDVSFIKNLQSTLVYLVVLVCLMLV